LLIDSKCAVKQYLTKALLGQQLEVEIGKRQIMTKWVFDYYKPFQWAADKLGVTQVESQENQKKWDRFYHILMGRKMTRE
jgi:hypothetical protein